MLEPMHTALQVQGTLITLVCPKFVSLNTTCSHIKSPSIHDYTVRLGLTRQPQKKKAVTGPSPQKNVSGVFGTVML